MGLPSLWSLPMPENDPLPFEIAVKDLRNPPAPPTWDPTADGPDERIFRWLEENCPELNAGKLRTEVAKQRAIVSSPSATAKEKGDAQRVLKALAKGLPALAAGLRDASRGFACGDPFIATAAVMEI